MHFLYDAHNHLQDEWLAPHRARIFADLASIGLRRAVVNGTCETDWPEVAALCHFDKLKAPSPSRGSQSSALGSQLRLLPSYGLHPWDAGNRSPDWQQNLLAQLDTHQSHSSPRCQSFPVAIGEIGLDRWILDRARPDDPRLAGLRRASLAEQIEVFAWQLALAAQRNLPASIHCLDAFGPLLDTLRSTPLPARGFLLHAYSGSAEMAESFAALGAYFSFNGAFLPPAAPRRGCQLLVDNPRLPGAVPDGGCKLLVGKLPRHLRRLEVFRRVPADRLLVETDAPAMRLPTSFEKFSLPAAADGSPVNHPANLAATYAALAQLRGTTVEDLAVQVEQNFQRLFG